MYFIQALASVVAVSMISLTGAFLISVREDWMKKCVFVFVSLAVGALLGDAFIHLIPEGLEEIGNPTVFSSILISGILLFFIIEKYLHWHHHNESKDVEHRIHPVGKLILLSDGVHNFIDGLLIGGSFLVSTELGVTTTIAVILHEIPQEIGDFGVLIHSGFSRTKALLWNFLSAISAVAGVIVAFSIGQVSEQLSIWLIPFAAGGFIYIALSDLIPELHKKDGEKDYFLIKLIFIVIGIASMFLLLGLE